MPVNAALTVNFRDFFALAPEIVLAVWGLVVLAADLGPFRRRPAEAAEAGRRRASRWSGAR